MNRYEKSILLMPKVITVLFVLICVINFILPIFDRWTFNLFRFVCLGWIPAWLGSIGILVNNTGIVENGIELQEQVINPSIIIVGIVRVIQVVYYFLTAVNSVRWVSIIALIVIDLIYLAIIILDKVRYGYGREIYLEEE